MSIFSPKTNRKSISLQDIIKELSLEVVFVPMDAEDIELSSSEVNRPGLQFAGFFDYFDNKRIQVIGKTEYGFLEQFPKDDKKNKIIDFVSRKPPAIILCRELEILPDLLDECKNNNVPLLRSIDPTSTFMSALIAFLNVQLAERITRHGVFIEAYGEGVLMVGDSGVGKSETAIELIKRGHRLIADDAVEIRKVSSKTLVGASPSNIRHFIELRGIGMVNAARIFGMGAVKATEKIDMVIKLEQWDNKKAYDRLGLYDEYAEIMGIKVPMLTIPVRPGRNLAVIIEVAAMNSRQKKMGYNAAQELMDNLGMGTDDNTPPVVHNAWEKY